MRKDGLNLIQLSEAESCFILIFSGEESEAQQDLWLLESPQR